MRKALNITVTTPAPTTQSAQLWAMVFMTAGHLVCTPALPGIHEQLPGHDHGRAANSNFTLAIVS